MRIWRVHPETGERFVPHQYGDGQFRVADPTLGKVKHHAENQIAVRTEDELVGYIRRGFLCRMRGKDSGKVNLISPDSITIDVPAASTESQREKATAPAAPLFPVVTHTPPAPPPRTGGQLPQHGRIACSTCFGGDATWGVTSLERDGWRLTNNPMAWGGQKPRVLVLGFSKGGNQNDDILNRPHDDVAFRGGRREVTRILSTLGLVPEWRTVDELIADKHSEIAFGSLVRCSVSKLDRRSGTWVMSGRDIMGSCLKDGAVGEVVSNCVAQFLAVTPPSLKLVVMFGNDANYVEGCFRAIAKHRPGLERINAVAYSDEALTFVHTIHFKAQGSFVPNWAEGEPGRSSRPETDQPLKRLMALEAVRPILPLLKQLEPAE